MTQSPTLQPPKSDSADSAQPEWHILIVDDNKVDRQRLRRLLLQFDPGRYSFTDAGSCEEALAVCRDQKPECVLVDYRMPKEDGLTFLEQLEKIPERNTSAVIMVTSLGDESIAVEALKRGAQDYLVKDALTPQTLHRAVFNAIEKGRLNHQLAEQARRMDRKNRELIELHHEMEAQNQELRGNQLATLNIMDDLEREVVERKRAEKLFRAAFEAIPCSLMMLDENGIIVQANSQATEFFSQSESIVGRQLVEILPQLRESDFSSVFATDGQEGPKTLRRMVHGENNEAFEMTLIPTNMPDTPLAVLAVIFDRYTNVS